VGELVGEHGLHDLRRAVEDVGAAVAGLAGRPRDRVEPDHDQPSGGELERGLERRVQARAAVAVPVPVDLDAREDGGDRTRGLHVLGGERDRQVVDAALVVGRGWCAAAVEDDAARGGVGRRDDRRRREPVLGDVALELPEVDQPRDRLRLRRWIEQAADGRGVDAEQLEPVQEHARELAERQQRTRDVTELDLLPGRGAVLRRLQERPLRLGGEVGGAERAGARADDDPRRRLQHRRQYLERAELIGPARASARQDQPDGVVVSHRGGGSPSRCCSRPGRG
jgi:hypothetical protein